MKYYVFVFWHSRYDILTRSYYYVYEGLNDSYEFYKMNEESNYYTKDGEMLKGHTGNNYNQMNIEWLSEQAVFSQIDGKFIYIWTYDSDIEYQLDVSDLSNPAIDDVCRDYWIVSDVT